MLIGIGLLLFLVGVVQIYGAKLLRRGAVTGGLYRIVRHPQYLALTVLGFGVILIWPRFLVLLSFVAMLFIYWALARWEESLCEEKFGDSYKAYQQRTGMIFPKVFGRGVDSERPARVSWQRMIGTFAVVAAIALAGAFALREYSLSQVSTVFTENVAMLSPAGLEPAEIELAYRMARSDRAVDEQLQAEPKLLAYVVPADWLLPDLPLNTEAEIRQAGGGHHTSEPSARIYRVLFTRPRSHAPNASGRAIVTRAYGHEPLAIVRVDLDSESVLGSDEVPDHVIWGDIPTPLF